MVAVAAFVGADKLVSISGRGQQTVDFVFMTGFVGGTDRNSSRSPPTFLRTRRLRHSLSSLFQVMVTEVESGVATTPLIIGGIVSPKPRPLVPWQR